MRIWAGNSDCVNPVNGRLDLSVKKNTSNGRSYLAEQYYKLPLQIMPPYYPEEDGTVFLYLLNPSGGVMRGDNFEINVSIGADVKAHVSTPSAGKIYGMEGAFAHQSSVFSVDSGGVLEYFPEYTLPYKDSRYTQRNEFHLKGDSRMIMCDAFSSGRAARGEIFEFDMLHCENLIYVDDKLVLADIMMLEPGISKISGPVLMGGHLCAATICAYSKSASEDVCNQIHSLLERADFEGGASMPWDGLVVVKLLSDKIRLLQNMAALVWNCLRISLLGKEFVAVRKY